MVAVDEGPPVTLIPPVPVPTEATTDDATDADAEGDPPTLDGLATTTVDVTGLVTVLAGAGVVVVIPATEDGAADGEAVVVADTGAAVATHAHTAAAALMTSMPVTAPHALSTQPCAADWMALDCETLHWQEKSAAPQPTPEAAERIQEF